MFLGEPDEILKIPGTRGIINIKMFNCKLNIQF